MKILVQARPELFEVGGGDKVQIQNTVSELKKLGVDVDISTDLDEDLSPYDIVHVFQLDWTPETYLYAKKARMAGKQLVLSPIHHSVKEVKRFDDEFVFDFRRIAKFIFREQHNRDTFKNVYRAMFSPKKIKPVIISIFMGLKNMHIKTLQMADIVLVQTEAEAHDLIETYNVNIRWVKVPNGVGAQFINRKEYEKPPELDFQDYVVSVGRIEARKNQLNIIKAIKSFREESGLDLHLLLIGKSSTMKHFEYAYRIKKLLVDNPWVWQIEQVPYAKMPEYYHFAKVCVSASWFETTGLTLLEALFSGTNAVASGERARECLGDLVSYCDPGDVESIKEAVRNEYFAERPELPSDMAEIFTWSNAARLTLKVYKDLYER